MKKKTLIHENLEGEEWRISNQTNELEVSNLGRVRSAQTGYIRSISYTKDGYAKVTGSKSRRSYIVHRLIYDTFVGPVDESQNVTFKDGNPTNLKLDNLIAVSRSAIQKKVERSRKPTNIVLSKQKVLTIWENVGRISISEIARHLGVSRSTVLNVLRGPAWDWIDHPNKAPYREEKQRKLMERFKDQ